MDQFTINEKQRQQHHPSAGLNLPHLLLHIPTLSLHKMNLTAARHQR